MVLVQGLSPFSLLTFNLFMQIPVYFLYQHFSRRPFLVMCKHVHISVYTLGLQRILIAYKKSVLPHTFETEPIQSVRDVFNQLC